MERMRLGLRRRRLKIFFEKCVAGAPLFSFQYGATTQPRRLFFSQRWLFDPILIITAIRILAQGITAARIPGRKSGAKMPFSMV